MSAYSVPTSAEMCIQTFVGLLNTRVKNMTTYGLFMPLIDELIEQGEGAINVTRVNRIIGELPQKALTAGAEAIQYLRNHWGPGLKAQPSKTKSKSGLTIRPPSPSPSPTPSISITNVDVPDRALLRDAAEQAGGTVTFSWAQRSLFQSLGIPTDTWNGFCAMTVGEFLLRPDTIQTKLKSQKGKIDLLHVHESYRSSGRSSYDFITSEFGLTFSGVTDAVAITPENTLRALETHSGTRHMIGLLKAEGGGHAVGVIVSSGEYTFFDAEEGQAELGNRDSFWLFLYRYITHETKGLDKQFKYVFVATWS